MQSGKTILCGMVLVFLARPALSQETRYSRPASECKSILIQYIKIDSGTMITETYTGACKNFWMKAQLHPNEPVRTVPATVPEPPVTDPRLLTVHGNISYDFIYRSGLDQQLLPQDLQQHTEKINLAMVYKEKYPFRLSFSSRQSNSIFFQRFLDLQLSFDPDAYRKTLKEKLFKQAGHKIQSVPDLEEITAELERKIARYNRIRTWVESSAVLQKLIEEKEWFVNDISNKASGIEAGMDQLKEGSFYSSGHGGAGRVKKLSMEFRPEPEQGAVIFQPAKDTTFPGSSQQKPGPVVDSFATNSAFYKLYEQQQKEMQLLADSIKALQTRFTGSKRQAQQIVAHLRQKISRAGSPRELKEAATEMGLAQHSGTRIDNFLAGIRAFGLGRTMLNHTDLTAKNIMVSGVNVVYNSSVYVAFSAGKIDYSFRDFHQPGTQRPGQYVVIGRIGLGDIDHKAIILSVFQGKKNSSPFALPDSIHSQPRVMGYSIEGILRGKNTSVSAEIAKSTKPRLGSASEKQPGELFLFSDKSNLGINIKAQTILSETGTKMSAFYRRTGKSFQSFSLFSYNTYQSAWMVRADQAFFRQRMNVSAALRQNDFSNPFATRTYKASTVFKSILLNVRLPKYPVFSAGFYPGTQVYYVDKEKMRENAYYVLNGSLVYNYQLSDLSMNSTLYYNRYFSQATDSGFVVNNGVNYYGSQTVFFKRLSWRTSAAWTRQTELCFYTIESSVNGSLQSFLRVGAAGKMNKVLHGFTYWAPQFSLDIDCRQLGNLTIQYERSYFPAINNTMLPIEFGRLSWYKTF